MSLKPSFRGVCIGLFTAVVLLAGQYSSFAQPAEGEPAEADAASGNGIPTDPAIISAGAELFTGNCKTCHEVHTVKIGPALESVYERRDLEWIKAFVRNSSKVIASGDDYAVALYEEYNKTQMTAFDYFTDDEILSVLAYIQDETIKGPVVEDTGGSGGEVVVESGVPDEYFNILMAGFVIVLVLILIVLVLIVVVLTRFLNQREDLDEEDKAIVNQRLDLGAFFRHRATIGIIGFIFVAIVLKTVVDGLFTVGVQQGYAPKQPIAFSHKIHAGQMEIECRYCHTGVMTAKSANIPSANICMNCHSQVKTDSKEIQKIYSAIEDNRPIEWVRVHNLPDLAYFNHSQHVNVGGIECQTCHGPIEEMEVVQQYSRLTMGWCIDCHRKTDVNTKGNAYYDKLVEIHNASGSKEGMKVKDIGGLECGKCHY